MKINLLVFYALLFLSVLFSSKIAIAQTPETLPQQISRIARQRGLSERLFFNLIAQESGGKARAVSNKGAACLTQLMPDTARRFGLRVDQRVDERFDNEKCLQAGATYLAWLLNAFRGDVRLALAGYNAGEGAVIKYGYRIPPYRQTVEYVEKICYRTYGQSGHGVAMAYNRNSAYSWTANLYANRRVPPNQTSAVTLQLIMSDILPAKSENDPNSGETAAVNQTIKPKVTRVATEAIQTRVRTESLYFWKQSSQEK